MQRKRSASGRPGKPSAPKKKAARKPPTTSAVREAADGRRSELVLAAYQLIAESGLEELRTRDIATKVGINISTLHYYFETKEALVVAVVDHMTELFRTVCEPLPDHPTALQELHHLFANQVYRRRAEPLLEIVVQEMMLRGRRDEKVGARLEVMLLAWNGIVEAVIARGIREGEVARDIDPKLAAVVVTSYLIGTNLQQGVRRSGFPFEPTSAMLLSWLSPK